MPELVLLNGLRNPRAWRKLGEVPFRAEAWPEGKVVRQAAAKALGFPVKDERWWPKVDSPWHRGRLPPPRDGVVLTVALVESTQQGPNDRIIIESDKIRLLNFAEAFAFWQKWWADGGKPIK